MHLGVAELTLSDLKIKANQGLNKTFLLPERLSWQQRCFSYSGPGFQELLARKKLSVLLQRKLHLHSRFLCTCAFHEFRYSSTTARAQIVQAAPEKSHLVCLGRKWVNACLWTLLSKLRRKKMTHASKELFLKARKKLKKKSLFLSPGLSTSFLHSCTGNWYQSCKEWTKSYL